MYGAGFEMNVSHNDRAVDPFWGTQKQGVDSYLQELFKGNPLFHGDLK